MGLWLGMVNTVSRRIEKDEKKVKMEKVYLGLNLSPYNFKVFKEKSETKSVF